MSSDNSFDQDNVFDEPNTVFDAAPPPAGGKSDKRQVGNKDNKGNKMPVWIWVVIGLAGLLMVFVLVRVLGGGRGAAASDELAPITQSSPQPVIAPAPAAQPPAAAEVAGQVAIPTASPTPSIPIPGDEPAPAVPNQTAAVAAAPVQAIEAAPAPAPVNTPVAQAQPPPAQAVSEALPDEERKALKARVAKLERQLRDLSPRTAATRSTARRSTTPAAKTPVTAKTATTEPAPIVGIKLKAIVENSAWLQNETGETVMVQPGDRLEGIGVVKAIDPDSGTVRLTDGRVLR